MDKNEVVEILKPLLEQCKGANGCLGYIEHFFTKNEEEALDFVIKTLEEDRWIPLSEKLPNTLGVYNVTRKIIEGETSYVISDACYFDGQNTWHADTGVNHGRPYITDVIAWKPKPEPYESEDK